MNHVSLIGAKSVMAEITAQLNAAKQKKTQDEIASLIDDLKEATPIDTGFAREEWKLENGKIVNGADYIDDLNAGSSKQAPAYFIEQTVISHDHVKPNGVIVTKK